MGSAPKTYTTPTPAAKLRTQIPKQTLYKPHGPLIHTTKIKARNEIIWKWRNKGYKVINSTNVRQGGVLPDQGQTTYQELESQGAASANDLEAKTMRNIKRPRRCRRTKAKRRIEEIWRNLANGINWVGSHHHRNRRNRGPGCCRDRRTRSIHDSLHGQRGDSNFIKWNGRRDVRNR